MQKRQWLVDAIGDLTHEQAAELAGTERSTFTKALNGYPISVRTAKQIGKAFGCDWVKFFDEKCSVSGQTSA